MNAWTTGGPAAAVTIKLQASPAGSGTSNFSFGCGKSDGTSSCDLGAVDPQSAHRQLQAQLTVPVTDLAVKSVSLTAAGSAAALPKPAKASASVTITAPGTSATARPAPVTPPLAPLPPGTVTSPLPVGSLPGISSAGLPPAGIPPLGIPTVGPAAPPGQGGNAAGLFPTVNPSPAPSFPSVGGASRVADTSALPEGASVVNAQLAGLAALALAFVLAVTRLSIRHPAGPAADQPGPEPGPDTGKSTKPGAEDKPDA